MFEVPEWAECSASSVPGLPVCLRAVSKLVTIIKGKPGESFDGFESLGVCNRHVEVAEAHLKERSELAPITVSRSEFPAFMSNMIGVAGA